MDIEDEGWVNIPYDDQLLQVHHDANKFFSRKFSRSPKNLFKLDYINSSQKSHEFVESPTITFPIQINDHQVVDDREDETKEITKLPILINNELVERAEVDFDPIFQVFFKKENEFVEMKMDFPRSNSWRTSLPCIETDKFQYEDINDDHLCNDSSRKAANDDEVKKVIKENIWKRGLNGIGVFWSLGMATATICIILFGNGHRHKQNQKLRIQLYSDDKRIKQVVHHANEAISAVRGPFNTAHITYGGYYEGF